MVGVWRDLVKKPTAIFIHGHAQLFIQYLLVFWLINHQGLEDSFHLFSLFKLKFDLCTLRAIRANHVSSSQSDRSKRVTCRCIKSLNAHFASLNAHFVEHKNAKATRRALKHLDHTFRCTKRYKALGQVNNGLDRG